jgi:hypothetical protein
MTCLRIITWLSQAQRYSLIDSHFDTATQQSAILFARPLAHAGAR